MVIKHASRKDIAALTAVETACFPPAEAATEKEFIDRVQYYGNHFWLLYEGDKMLAFVDGFVTDEPDLTDVMYEDAALHNEQGAWQMIFGVDRIVSYLSHFITLKIGDLIFTGTPVGVGPVRPGDRLQAWLEGRMMFDFDIK